MARFLMTRCKRCVVASVFLMFSQFSMQSQAILIDLGATTLDTESGLEWLDLTETLDITPLDVLMGVGGYLFEGWSVATGPQVDALFSEAGVPTPSGGPQFYADTTVTDMLLELLGVTRSVQNVGEVGQGWAINAPNVYSAPFFESSVIPSESVSIGSDNTLNLFASNAIGVFLAREYRQVSTVGTLPLLFLAYLIALRFRVLSLGLPSALRV